ncbi:hypothetical protein Gotur_009192 [Gossypium turneri]
MFSFGGFEGIIPKKKKLRNPAKVHSLLLKQGLHQPWLKQKPLDYQNNAGLVELRQTFRLQAHEMVCVNFWMLLFLLLCNFFLSRPFIFHLVSNEFIYGYG